MSEYYASSLLSTRSFDAFDQGLREVAIRQFSVSLRGEPTGYMWHYYPKGDYIGEQSNGEPLIAWDDLVNLIAYRETSS